MLFIYFLYEIQKYTRKIQQNQPIIDFNIKNYHLHHLIYIFHSKKYQKLKTQTYIYKIPSKISNKA